MSTIKREVYNGYKEAYMTGAELKDAFPHEYYVSGRHHQDIYAITIKDYLELSHKIKDDIQYRVFYNDDFCKVMSSKTDKEVLFFSHSHVPSDDGSVNICVPRECPICGSPTVFKDVYSPFIGCKNYKECGFSQKIEKIGIGF